ncbi:hypothetical protein FPV67DRAFT_1433855 [Lyophyllum atratum]|nr:hypothetical protein FPV67DRAFT_1433855 [Lyophyllum atratum]
MKRCVQFLKDQKLISKDDLFFSATPSANTPSLIVAWIMDSCDEIRLDGTRKPKEELRDGYTHAQKMRASMTYAFGRLHGLGSLPWHPSETTDKMLGNPSVSNVVSSYMVSLKRRKVQGGEAATSARAITPEIMKRLFIYNNRPENRTIKPYVPGKRGDKALHEWGGARTRRLLTAIYTLAFTCLLRFDEVVMGQGMNTYLKTSLVIRS